MDSDTVIEIVKYLNNYYDISSLSRVCRQFHTLVRHSLPRICQQKRLPVTNSFHVLEQMMWVHPKNRLKMLCIDGFIPYGFIPDKDTDYIKCMYHAAKRDHRECIHYISNHTKICYTTVVTGAIRGRRYDLVSMCLPFADLTNRKLLLTVEVYSDGRMREILGDIAPSDYNSLMNYKGVNNMHDGIFYSKIREGEIDARINLTAKAAKYYVKYWGSSIDAILHTQITTSNIMRYLFKLGRCDEFIKIYDEIHRVKRHEGGWVMEWDSIKDDTVSDLTTKYPWIYAFVMGMTDGIRNKPGTIMSQLQRDVMDFRRKSRERNYHYKHNPDKVIELRQVHRARSTPVRIHNGKNIKELTGRTRVAVIPSMRHIKHPKGYGMDSGNSILYF